MTGWSDWNYINVFFVFFSGFVSYMCFIEENNKAGWLNLFASSVNFAIIGVKFL